jgi:endonuclease/exonuclease/phosphatase family metal-dependent hydrolase
MELLTLCQHNILAPLWVDEKYQLLPCRDLYTAPDRLLKTLAYLRGLTKVDIYCLCEVEQNQLDIIWQHMPEYYCIFGSNRTGFWSEYLSKRQWAGNGTCTLIKKGNFSIVGTELIDFGDGCRCTLVTLRKRNHSLHSSNMFVEDHNNPLLTIITVHFDTGAKKFVEANLLLQMLDGVNGPVIIAGDYNFTDISMFIQHGYIETVRHRHDPNTTPIPQGPIDHTLVKHAVPIYAFTDTMHNKQGLLEDPLSLIKPICRTVALNGSDHYATLSYIAI